MITSHNQEPAILEELLVPKTAKVNIEWDEEIHKYPEMMFYHILRVN